ncbi:MAG TPA: HupE/UreJ family protein [Labilithrix sp.]|nr:HupE/UreJ family protein [Labilithrix sp.]
MLALALLFAMPAAAHTIGLSTGEYTARGSSLVGKLAFARAEVAALAPALDANRDGHLTPAEVQAGRSLLLTKVLDRISVTSNGAACTATVTDAGLMEQDGLLLSGRWDCASSDHPFEVDLLLLGDLARGHRHIARTVTGGTTHDEVLDATQRNLPVAPEPASGAMGTEARPEPASGQGGWRLFVMGLEHILTGYDHLLFLLGLVLLRSRLRSLLGVVTAFTIAHSVTLALAALHVWAPNPRIVEPAIALSIVYVGVENFFVADGSKRWRITFPFGLVHGFGFAGALEEIALPRSAVPGALVSFNLGVEAGQLAVLLVLLPLLVLVRDRGWFGERGLRVASGAIVLAGGVWFVARVVSG